MKQFVFFLLLTANFLHFARAQSTTTEFDHLGWQEMDSLLTVYYFQNDLEKTQKLAQLELAKAERDYGKKHLFYITSLSNNGALSIALGEFDKARVFLKEAVMAAKENLHPDDPLLVDCSLNLATAYDNVGEAAKSLELFEIYMPKAIIQYGKDNPTYAFHLNSFAAVCTRTGQHQRAIPMYLEVVEIFRDEALEPWRFPALSNLIACYMETGQYDYALRKTEEALALAEKINAQESHDYTILLHNVASLHHATGNYAKALEIMAQGDQFMREHSADDLTEYCHWVNLHSMLRAKTGKAGEAIPELQAVLGMAENSLGKGHFLLATLRNNLALMLTLDNRNEEALKIHEEALSDLESHGGVLYPEYAEILADLANLYEKMGNNATGATFHQRATDMVMNRIDNQFDHLSEREQLALAQRPYNIVDRLNRHQSFAIRNPTRADAVGACYDALLLGKGIAVGNRKRLLQAARNNSEPGVTKTFIEWEQTGIFLSAEYKKKIEQRSPVFDSLEFRANVLENELTRASQSFKEARQRVVWQQVQTQLADDEAAIEFAHFHYFNKFNWSDSSFYCAYILRKGWDAPRMVFLFEEKELEQLFKAIPNRGKESLDKLYTARNLQPQKSTLPTGEELARLVWQPLDSLLDGVKRVFYSPSGLLNRVNFAAIPSPIPGQKSGTLADRYELYCLGSTRQLAFRQTTIPPKINAALLFGGIRYDVDSTAQATSNQAPGIQKPGDDLAFKARGGVAGLNYLDGTLREVQAIGAALKKAGFEVQVKEGHGASEEAFKQLGRTGPSPGILHIATHGYFFPDPKTGAGQNAVAASDHPMIRSGLILAGANPAWQGQEPPEGKDDGILTAYEISQMNLRNTELVVLSACETGLGDIAGNEGVYGLQRAFKIAGAKYLIMSLWDVPDEETAEFMTSFYREWLGGKDIHAAFRATQRGMREAYPKEPFLWAGFVLVE